jgi:hypothetical protein
MDVVEPGNIDLHRGVQIDGRRRDLVVVSEAEQLRPQVGTDPGEIEAARDSMNHCISLTCQQPSQRKVSTRCNHDTIISASAGMSSRSNRPETIRTVYPGEAGTRGVPPIRPVRFNGSVAERTNG